VQGLLITSSLAVFSPGQQPVGGKVYSSYCCWPGTVKRNSRELWRPQINYLVRVSRAWSGEICIWFA